MSKENDKERILRLFLRILNALHLLYMASSL